MRAAQAFSRGAAVTSRITKLVEDGKRRSGELTSSLPERGSKRLVTHERIVEVCARLVTASPAREPTAPAVSEFGRTLFKDFPRGQSLLNSYRDELRIWRDVYRDVTSASLPKTRGSEHADNDPDSVPDFGSEARIKLLTASLHEARLENDRLKKLIQETIPLPGSKVMVDPSRDLPQQMDLLSLKEWLDDVNRGAMCLDVTPTGLVVSRAARPGFRVLPETAWNTIKAIVGSIE